MGLVSLPPHHLPSFSPEFAHSLHTLFCHSSIFPNIREMIGGQWWAFIFTNKKQEAARTTLFKTCAQGPQPPNLLPWLWKQIKPTGLGLIGGAGGALGFTTNGDWELWEGTQENTGGILQLSWRVRPTGASPVSVPVGRGP